MTVMLFAIRDVWLFDHGLPLDRIPMALVVTGLFGVTGYLTRGVTKSGAIAGTLLAFALFIAGGPPAFVTLLGVFVLTWLVTRIGYMRKTGMGLAENRKGRNANQVLANVGAATGFALAGIFFPQLQIASAAALAEAAADTASSECGEALGRRAYLITTMKRVDVGVDGGISLPGTLAGLISALLIAAVAASSNWIPTRQFALVGAAGLAGTLMDSLLGATLERRRWISNNGVNFVSTLAAGFLSLLLLQI